jgi:hypothetical protein
LLSMELLDHTHALNKDLSILIFVCLIKAYKKSLFPGSFTYLTYRSTSSVVIASG